MAVTGADFTVLQHISIREITGTKTEKKYLVLTRSLFPKIILNEALGLVFLGFVCVLVFVLFWGGGWLFFVVLFCFS